MFVSLPAQDVTYQEFESIARHWMRYYGETLGSAGRYTTCANDGHMLDVRYQARSERRYEDGKPAVILDLTPTTWPPAPVWLEPIPAKS